MFVQPAMQAFIDKDLYGACHSLQIGRVPGFLTRLSRDQGQNVAAAREALGPAPSHRLAKYGTDPKVQLVVGPSNTASCQPTWPDNDTFSFRVISREPAILPAKHAFPFEQLPSGERAQLLASPASVPPPRLDFSAWHLVHRPGKAKWSRGHERVPLRTALAKLAKVNSLWPSRHGFCLRLACLRTHFVRSSHRGRRSRNSSSGTNRETQSSEVLLQN
jgi:hypothetical protein